jgi:hypothetical protein
MSPIAGEGTEMSATQTKKDWKSNPVVIGLLLFFFTPLGLISMRLNDWRKQTKWIITAVVALPWVILLIIVLLPGPAVNSTSYTPPPSNAPAAVQQQPSTPPPPPASTGPYVYGNVTWHNSVQNRAPPIRCSRPRRPSRCSGR